MHANKNFIIYNVYIKKYMGFSKFYIIQKYLHYFNIKINY